MDACSPGLPSLVPSLRGPRENDSRLHGTSLRGHRWKPAVRTGRHRRTGRKVRQSTHRPCAHGSCTGHARHRARAAGTEAHRRTMAGSVRRHRRLRGTTTTSRTSRSTCVHGIIMALARRAASMVHLPMAGTVVAGTAASHLREATIVVRRRRGTSRHTTRGAAEATVSPCTMAVAMLHLTAARRAMAGHCRQEARLDSRHPARRRTCRMGRRRSTHRRADPR